MQLHISTNHISKIKFFKICTKSRFNDPVPYDIHLFPLCRLDAINKAAQAWGIKCLRYEIRDIKMPERVAEAMQLQVEAERSKRARVLESEGVCIT